MASSSSLHQPNSESQGIGARTIPIDSSIFATNDIDLAVGMALNDEDKVKFLNPWQASKENEYPPSIRNDRAGHVRRLNKNHLIKFPWLAVSKVNKGAFCIPCVLFGGIGVGGRSFGQDQSPGALVARP